MIVRGAAPYDYQQLCIVIAEIDQYHREALPHFFRRNPGEARPLQWLWAIRRLGGACGSHQVTSNEQRAMSY